MSNKRKTYTYAESFRQTMDDIVFLSDDPHDAIYGLIRFCGRKHLITRLSSVSGIASSNLYYISSEERSPRLLTAQAILNALGYELKVVRKT